MPLGKTFTQTLVSDRGPAEVYSLVQKVAKDMNLKVSTSQINGQVFRLEASEPMKWLSTNWPVKIEVTSEPFQGNLVIKVTAYGKMVSITQDSNTSKFLDNYVSSLSAYLGASAVQQRVAAAGTGANFCPSCGTKLNSSDQKFCQSCGTRLREC